MQKIRHLSGNHVMLVQAVQMGMVLVDLFSSNYYSKVEGGEGDPLRCLDRAHA